MNLLRILLDGDFRGKSLSEEYSKRYRKKIPNGTLYTALRRLREDGWTTSGTALFSMREKVFKLTKKGRANLPQVLDLYRRMGE